MNKYHQFLRMRRSVRRFKGDPSTGLGQRPIPASVVDTILHTTTFAPSAHNLQPWRFVKVASDLGKEKLGDSLISKLRADMASEGAPQATIEKRAQHSLARISKAPLIIILCRDKTALREDTKEEEIMAIQSTAVAGLQLLLAAEAEGLSGSWVCWVLYAQSEIINALDLPENWLPEAMFFLGYADEEPQKSQRYLNEDLTIIR